MSNVVGDNTEDTSMYSSGKDRYVGATSQGQGGICVGGDDSGYMAEDADQADDLFEHGQPGSDRSGYGMSMGASQFSTKSEGDKGSDRSGYGKVVR